jgi:drug/metabolite transporter (DMT)-like permease
MRRCEQVSRTVVLTTLAMIAFAANSVLARLALAMGGIDAAGYTGVRLVAGALALLAISTWVNRKTSCRQFGTSGTWLQAIALFGYALAFSVAYLMLGASTGALVLFGSVQLGMLARAIVLGDRPGAWEWIGLAVAFGAMIYLVSPGVSAPDPLGVVLMVVAGLCWAGYSLLGRGSTTPLADTTGNFMRCMPAAVVIAAWGLSIHPPTANGLIFAVASGAIASGVGYAIWYAALPHLSRARAAIVQLSVPAIAAVGAVAFVGEPLTVRLVISSIAVIGAVGVAIVAGDRRRSRSTS